MAPKNKLTVPSLSTFNVGQTYTAQEGNRFQSNVSQAVDPLLRLIGDQRFNLSYQVVPAQGTAAGTQQYSVGVQAGDADPQVLFGPRGNFSVNGLGGYALLTQEDGPGRSISAVKLASRALNANQGISLIDFSTRPDQEFDWRLIGVGGNPNLQFQAAAGGGYNFQANVGSNRGMSVGFVGPFVYWDGGGLNRPLIVSAQNGGTGVLGSVTYRWTAPFPGSIIAISGRYEVANANTARVDIYKNGALVQLGINVTPSATLKWNQTFAKNVLTFNAGDDIYLQQIFSSPLNQWNTATLTVEIDTAR